MGLEELHPLKNDPILDQAIDAAAQCISKAEAVLIAAGAGMGVDSGLPDFRGPGGFWGVYPALGQRNMHFDDIANPQAFRDDPRLAWGFYGYRLQLYRHTPPGKSFDLLRTIGEQKRHGVFVFTSNVDGHFQAAGFDPERVCEIHGSIHHLQCLAGCSDAIWSAKDFQPVVDTLTCRMTSELPLCPRCGGVARPNILMFGDAGWNAARQERQMDRLLDWLGKVKGQGVVIEVGAGTAIPTVRHFGVQTGFPIVRINKAASAVKRQGDVALPMSGKEALTEILNKMM